MLEEVKKFHKNGYIVLKNCFSKEEISAFKSYIKTLNDSDNLVGELMGRPVIGDAFFNKKMISFLKTLFNDDVVYFGDSSARYELRPGHRGMHKDSNHDLNIFPSNGFPIVMGGIYLQDHKYHSGGLKLVPGSHKKVFLSKKTIYEFFANLDFKNLRFFIPSKLSINVQSEVGDVVLWSQRLNHSPYALRLKIAPNLSLRPFIENYIPSSWILPNDGPRGAILFSFGGGSEYSEQLEFHIKKFSERRSNFLRWKFSNYDTPAVRELASKNGIKLRYDGVRLVKTGFIPVVD